MMYRVLLINWRDILNPEAGGAETYYHEIFKRLAVCKAYHITVLSHAVPGLPACEEVDGTQIIRCGSRSLFNYAAMRWVLSHGSAFDLVIEDINKIPFFTPLYRRRPRLHLLMHFFGSSIFREVVFPAAAYIYALERLVSLIYRRERFVAISKSTRDELLARCGRRIHIDVVEPGIAPSSYRPTQPKDPTPTLVYFGRLKKYKNVQTLIKCLPAIREKVAGTRLIVAGAGDYRPALEALVGELGLNGAVSFTGFVTEQEKLDILSRATIKVNPSCKEGWGITNIEAALCGTVSVSADVAGLRDSVRDGVTGLLYNPRNDGELVAKVVRLLTDEHLRKELERNAAAFAASFTWDAAAEKMKRVLEEVLHSPARGGSKPPLPTQATSQTP